MIRNGIRHIAKGCRPIVTIDEGIEIDSSDEQFSKADSPRIEMLLRGSNVTEERLAQRAKQLLETVPMDEGINID
jgi:hypothetical protein